mmetsp:Transcript_42455/g.113597  ORF Transcript_42455/g.113597 Transcript_42455/m.113597 type:complete len:108 (-) Transcript_42455:1977-2300(-)
MLRSPEVSAQRLSSCAICNICAHHPANQRQAREAGALTALVDLLASEAVEVLAPAAGAVCNLAMLCPENREELLRLGATSSLHRLVLSPVPPVHGNALAALEQLVDP